MILNDNSTQQINTLVIQLQNKITNLTNEFRKLNNNINDLDREISDLEKRISSNENDADNNIDDLDSKISDLEKRVSSNENDAAAMNTEILANTEAISGKADKIHTHTKSEITDFDHTHDDRYYTESEIDAKLSGKSDTGHTHTKSEITDFDHTHDDRYYTESEIDAKLSGKTDIGHNHDSVYFRTTGNLVDPTKFSNWMNTNGSYVDKTNQGWLGSVYTFYAGFSQSGLMFRILGGKSGPNQVQMNYSIDSNRFGMEWATIINSDNISLQPVIKSLEQRIAALESKI